MKLISENGEFDFIRNSEVKIDSSLPKFNELSRVSSKKSHYAGTFSSFGDTESELVEADPDVDELTAQEIKDAGFISLKQYLGTDTAAEFNKKFQSILNGEIRINRDSTNVVSSRLVPYRFDDAKISTPEKNSKFKKLLKGIKKLFVDVYGDRDLVIEKEASINLVDFFDTIHVMCGEEKQFFDHLSGYFEMLDSAIKMRQVSQVNELVQNIIIHIYESVLAAHGMNKYILFSELEKLEQPGKRVVDICYVENFGQVIPKDIVEKKLDADNLCVFDNYCVLYYDPTGKTYKVPEKVKRDPILFGLINHSPKLYYVADWVSDTCDLTLDKIAASIDVKIDL